MHDARPCAGRSRQVGRRRTAFNRGQILYRLGEMIEGRSAGWTVPDVGLRTGMPRIDRAVFFAGWADKIGAVLSTLNPVGWRRTSTTAA